MEIIKEQKVTVLAPMTKVRVDNFEGHISQINIKPDLSITYVVSVATEEGALSIGDIYEVQMEVLDDTERLNIGFKI